MAHLRLHEKIIATDVDGVKYEIMVLREGEGDNLASGDYGAPTYTHDSRPVKRLGAGRYIIVAMGVEVTEVRSR